MTTILSRYDSFAFSILPCGLEQARSAVKMQASKWNKAFSVDRWTLRDIRPIYDSETGPSRLPAIYKAMLLSETDGDAGPRTLFVSSVADGYSSMVHMLSKTIPGRHLSVRVSRPDVEYPGSFLTAIADNRTIRTVYSMREDRKWVFYEEGCARIRDAIELSSAIEA